MLYELAKQLSDAGFPQGGAGTWSVPPDKIVSRREDRIYVPTLEELLEAVGPNFHYVLKLPHEWKAFGINSEVGRGQRPIDAVARLWLAINSRQRGEAEQSQLGGSEEVFK
jgi:hypothetical protein